MKAGPLAYMDEARAMHPATDLHCHRFRGDWARQPTGPFDAQLDVRELLRAQDRTEWVIISTGMFTSFLFEPVFEVVDLKNDTVNALGKA